MDAEQRRGITDAAFGPLERAGDENLLEFPPCVVVEHAAIEHLLNERFQLVAHGLPQFAARQEPVGLDVLVARPAHDLVWQ